MNKLYYFCIRLTISAFVYLLPATFLRDVFNFKRKGRRSLYNKLSFCFGLRANSHWSRLVKMILHIHTFTPPHVHTFMCIKVSNNHGVSHFPALQLAFRTSGQPPNQANFSTSESFVPKSSSLRSQKYVVHHESGVSISYLIWRVLQKHEE